jgi:hypothetical protein
MEHVLGSNTLADEAQLFIRYTRIGVAVKLLTNQPIIKFEV